jgi:hypothetical protein
MAKKKKADTGAKKAKKKKKDGFEQTLGKVEEKLGKVARAAEELSHNPIVADLVAAGMTAAAAALAQSRAGRKAQMELVEAGEEAAEAGTRAAASLKQTAIDVARSMLDAFEAAGSAESATSAGKGGGTKGSGAKGGSGGTAS